MGWYVYMLKCGDGSLYTGATSDLLGRLEAHQRGNGAKYTRSHLPVSLVYWETAQSRSAALRREAAIKKLTRKEKLALVSRDEGDSMPPRPSLPLAQMDGAVNLLFLQMNDQGGERREGIGCGGRQSFHHTGLSQNGGGFKTQRDNGLSLLQIGAQTLHGSGGIFGSSVLI